MNEMFGVSDSNRGVSESVNSALVGGALNSMLGRGSTDTEGMNREERRRRARK